MPSRSIGLTVSPVRTALIAAAAMLALAPRSSAAQNPVEFGIDAKLTLMLDTPEGVSVQIPDSRFRVGFFATPNIEVEPAIGVSVLSTTGETITAYEFTTGLLLHMRSNRAKPQLYVRPFAGLTGVTGSLISASSTQLGAGLGVKIPLRDRIGTRVEVGFGHHFASKSATGGNRVFLGIGLSFFTH